MKLRILVENQNHLMALGKLALKDKQLEWDLSEAQETAIEKIKKFLKLRDELIIKHGKKQENTENYEVTQKNTEIYQTEYDKIIDVDVAVKFPTMKIADVPFEVTVDDMRAWKKFKILTGKK